MTYDEKVKAYNEDKWSCPVPPVCTARWDVDSWIKWIDAEGHWNTKEAPCK